MMVAYRFTEVIREIEVSIVHPNVLEPAELRDDGRQQQRDQAAQEHTHQRLAGLDVLN